MPLIDGIYAYDGTEEASPVDDLLNLLADSVRAEVVTPAAKVTKTSTQSTSSSAGTPVAIAFNTETFDTHAMHDNTTNTTRLTCQKAGIYRVTGKANVQATGVGYASLVIAKNGTSLPETQVTIPGPVAGYPRPLTTDLVPLDVGDYIELLLSSSATSTTITPADCTLSAVWERALP